MSLFTATGRRTGGTTAHLLDFTAASANHLGGGHFRAHSPVAAPAAVARSPATGSLMDDDMQVCSPASAPSQDRFFHEQVVVMGYWYFNTRIWLPVAS